MRTTLACAYTRFGLIAGVAFTVACRHAPTPGFELFVDTAPDLDGELRIDGRLEQLTVSPDGRIWLTSMLGEIAVGESMDSPWRHLLEWPEPVDDDPLSAPFHVSDQRLVGHFTPDTMISVGFGTELLRSVDGGESWDTVRFSNASERDAPIIDAVFALPSGSAWIGGLRMGGRGSLFATHDYGVTWAALPLPWDERVSSIYMENGSAGVLGGLWGDLALTEDGGRTWTVAPTPYEQGVVPESDDAHVLEAVARVGAHVIVQQGDRVFQSARAPIEWMSVAGDLRRFAFDPDERVLYGLDANGRVLRYDENLEPSQFGDLTTRGPAIAMAARGGKVVVLELGGAMLEVTAEASRYGFPLTASFTERIWQARLDGDRVWGVTYNHIYRSDDLRAGDSRTWDRVGFMPSGIRSFLVRSDGRLLLWDGHGGNLVYDPDTGVLRSWEPLDGYDVVDIRQIGDRWVAFGGMQWETTRRIEVARTYHEGQFQGTKEHGFVLVSDDEGESWQQIDEWEDGGVANLFVDPVSGDMILVSYLGGVRRLDASAGYAANELIMPTEDTWDAVPYVEEPKVVHFEGDQNGYIEGWTHYLGEKRWETSDGGRTWREIPITRPEVRSLDTPTGRVVVHGAFWGGEHARGGEVVFRSGGRETLLLRPEPPTDGDPFLWPGITDVSVDRQGRVLAVVNGRELVILSP